MFGLACSFGCRGGSLAAPAALDAMLGTHALGLRVGGAANAAAVAMPFDE